MSYKTSSSAGAPRGGGHNNPTQHLQMFEGDVNVEGQGFQSKKTKCGKIYRCSSLLRKKLQFVLHNRKILKKQDAAVEKHETQFWISRLKDFSRDALKIENVLRNRGHPGNIHADIMELCKILPQVEESIKLVSAETNAMQQNIKVWGEKYTEKIKSLKKLKFVIKYAGEVIQFGIQCLMLLGPQMTPVVLITQPIIRKMEDWITYLCDKKLERNEKMSAKISNVGQVMLQTKLDHKLGIFSQEFESCLEVFCDLATWIESDKTDRDETSTSINLVIKAKKSREDLLVHVGELKPAIQKVVASYLELNCLLHEQL